MKMVNFISYTSVGNRVQYQVFKKTILQKLKTLRNKESALSVEEPDYNKPSRFRPNPQKQKVVWVKPKLCCGGLASGRSLKTVPSVILLSKVCVKTKNLEMVVREIPKDNIARNEEI
jgi:hypothetical protein